MSPAVDVVVVAYGSRDLLGSCLSKAAEIPGLTRLIVVDHGDDGSSVLASDFGADTVLDQRNPGFGAGQNNGASRGNAPFVLLLNPDAVIAPEAVRRGIEVLEEDPAVAAVQGLILGPDGTLERSQGRALGPLHLAGRALHLRRLLRSTVVRRAVARLPIVSDTADRSIAAPADVGSLAATVLLVRRSAFEAVGGFDERYFLYGEDLDLCQRLRRRGFRLLALPETWACHQSGASSGSSWSRELHWWSGTLTYAVAWWSPPAVAVGALAGLVVWAQLIWAQPAAWRRLTAALLWKPWLTGREIRRTPLTLRVP